MKKYIILLIFISLHSTNLLYGTTNVQFSHYSTDDGLPQYTIMDLLQDKKGFLWVATWDGLSKFDGFNFKNYKLSPEHPYFIKSNRIQRLIEDKYGRIWFESYDGDFHCFDPGTEQYWGLQLTSEHKANTFLISDIIPLPSGAVWLRSNMHGAVLVKDSTFAVNRFNTQNQQLKSNTVNGVFEDKSGKNWILTNNGVTLYRPKTNAIEHLMYSNDDNGIHNREAFFSAFETDHEILLGAQKGKVWRYAKSDGKIHQLQTPSNSDIKKILRGSTHEIILVTEDDGFMLFNPQSSKISKYNSFNTRMKSNQILSTYADVSGNFWFDTKTELGIYRFNYDSKKLFFHQVRIEDVSALLLPPISIVIEDVNGRVWVQPRGGGFSMFNKTTDELEPFFNDPLSPDRRFSNIVHSALSDRQGNLWMCTRSHGLEKVVFSENYFNLMPVNPSFGAQNANDVRAVYQDRQQRIWVSTKDTRVTLYDRNRKLIGRLAKDGSIRQDALWHGIVYDITEDYSGNIWLGTKGDGLFQLSSTNENPPYKVVQFQHNPDKPFSISDNNIYSIYIDNNGNIWIGTYGGGINLLNTDFEGNIRFLHHNNEFKGYPFAEANRVRTITANRDGVLCVGTTGGLVMFKPDEIKNNNKAFKLYTRIPGDISSISNNDIHGITITETGDMYLATFGGGLNKVIDFSVDGFPTGFKSFTTRNGLPSDVILAMVEDEQGKLWITNENNLSRFDPAHETFETYPEIRGIKQHFNFSEASNYRLRSNNIIFGTSHGMLSFYPGQITNSNYVPYIALTGFQLFNTEQAIHPKGILKRHVDDLREIVLSHKQNFFTIEYTTLDFKNPENITFAYILDGFEKEWNYVQKQRKANYTNLPHGEYTFKVKSTNSDGVWVENERQLSIVVTPSFWVTTWAIMLYLLIVMVLLFVGVRILLTFYRLKHNAEIDKQLSEMKLRFFTDISHEIRTPLTMITAPVDHLMTDAKTPDHIRKQLQLISQNTSRMLRLVNQILDLRKIQFMKLKVYETELAPLIEDICGNFTEIAASNRIQFRFVNLAGNERVWVDPDCIDKIVMNLLSNAFKFTPEGRMIQVTVCSDDKSVTFQVRDEGKGLQKETQRNLFTRFASFNIDKSKPSTGIGLSMVKDLADKHGARITVDSEEGKGTSISVSFQKGIEHFSSHVEIVAAGPPEMSANSEFGCPPSGDTLTSEIKKQAEKPNVLVVEDDPDLRQFIVSILEEEYKISEAEDGEEGLKIALQEIPDFIVSDIMMPKKDGVEMLNDLKGNIVTSHIPVVLLTAKTTIESKLEGLAQGADDYITKPFSVSYFKARIANLIAQRKHLQELYRKNSGNLSIANYEPQPYNITSQDDSLMRNVMTVIEKNMENFEFSVDDLREEVGMSRSAFFKKMKGLTGLAPIEFIRDIKMKRAAQLLASGQYRVKEVTFMIGFSDSKYFAKCFKEKFGITPVEYKNKDEAR